MLRRTLPVLAAAAAVVALVPGTASAAPAQAPAAETLRFQSYFAQGDVVMPDGRRVSASVSEIPRIEGKGSDAGLTLWVQPAADCWQTTRDCESGTGSGHAPLDAGDIGFDRRLSGVTLSGVAVTLHRSDWSTYPPVTHSETVVVDVRLTGTGASTHTAEHGPTCGDDSTQCQATRVAVQRSGQAQVSMNGLTGSGLALLSFGKSIDVAVPQVADAGGN